MDPLRAAKLISYALRADPSSLGLEPDVDGWVAFPVLLRAMNSRGHRLSRGELVEILHGAEASRFEWDEPGDRLRAAPHAVG